MSKYPLAIMFAMLGLCWIISWLYPLPSILGFVGVVLGWVILLCGIFLILLAGRLFMIKGTTSNPTKEPDKLVTSGIYRVTRNPMYLGAVLILTGFPFVVKSMIGLIFPVVFFIFMDRKIIPDEERLVERIFGHAYLEYKLHTRRWI
jgi:protein-S-isoprenylcysteine O-methyltransferase Ste14